MKNIKFNEYLKIAFEKKLYMMRWWRINMLLRLAKYERTDDMFLYPSGVNYAFKMDGEEYLITDLDGTKPPAKWRTVITVLKGTTPQIKEDTLTIFGNLLNNTIVFAHYLGDRVPYNNGYFTVGSLHKAYFKLYKEKNITAQELVASTSAFEELVCDADFGVPAASITTFTTHPDMEKAKAEVLAKYAGKTNDPLVQAEMDAKLVGLDKEHVKGTSAQDFIISGKQHAVVRKKTMIMYGSESDLSGNPTPLVTKSLEEGLDMEHMDSWVNAARAGSYGRGAMTALGGADVKQDYLAYGHLMVKAGDCKTKKGLNVLIKPAEYHRLAGMRLMKDDSILDVDTLQKQIGKILTIRVPGCCQYPDGFYCEHCMGAEGSKVFSAIPTEVSIVDSNSMDAMMQAAHGKARVAVKIDLKYYAC